MLGTMLGTCQLFATRRLLSCQVSMSMWVLHILFISRTLRWLLKACLAPSRDTLRDHESFVAFWAMLGPLLGHAWCFPSTVALRFLDTCLKWRGVLQLQSGSGKWGSSKRAWSVIVILAHIGQEEPTRHSKNLRFMSISG